MLRNLPINVVLEHFLDKLCLEKYIHVYIKNIYTCILRTSDMFQRYCNGWYHLGEEQKNVHGETVGAL